MFSEFLNSYPNGSLISELLKIYEGKYIVRVVVQVNSVPVATGLAAEDSLEIAEDRARLRALAVLGIQPSATEVYSSRVAPTQNLEPLSLREETALKKGRSLPTRSREVTPQSTHQGSGRTSVTSVSTAQPASLAPQYSNYTSPAGDNDWLSSGAGSAGSWEAEESLMPQTTSGSTSRTYPSEFETQTDSNYLGSTGSMGGSSAGTGIPIGPVDLSDIIAQTTVEIQRLGWTTEHGRTHLEQTYGKRSRSLLNEEELLDFLHYLRAQPTPN